MAVAEARGTPRLGTFLRQRRRSWSLIAGYIVLSLTLMELVPAWLPVGDPMMLHRESSGWVLSGGTEARNDTGVFAWTNRGGATNFASYLVPVASDTEFLALRACVTEDAGLRGNVALMLASVNGERLDFNRAYRLYGFEHLDPGACASESFPRWKGDREAVLQLQFLQEGGSIKLSELTVTPLRENPRWRVTRWIMLPLGLALVVYLFWPYGTLRPRLFTAAGLLVVAGIIFGVCVSVPLKADIYAIMTGGREIAALSSVAEILRTPFPIGSFSIFTQLHAVFFAGACFWLLLVERRAWLDLLVLAAMTETLQIFVPGRGPGVEDALVDISGVALGCVSVFLILRSQRIRLFLQQQGVHQDISGL